MVPSSSWNVNLRSLLSRQEWDVFRRDVYRKAGYVCEVCGGKGRRHPVECHEVWKFDLKRGVQVLAGAVALCPACHEVKHIGLATVRGRFVQACAHMKRVNGITEAEAVQVVAESYARWKMLSAREWKMDVSWIDGFKGVTIGETRRR